MGDELAELENRLTDFLYGLCDCVGESYVDVCGGIKCSQCPIFPENARLTARGFLRELTWERRDWME